MNEKIIETLNDKTQFAKLNYKQLKKIAQIDCDFEFQIFDAIDIICENEKLNKNDVVAYFSKYDIVYNIFCCNDTYIIFYNSFHYVIATEQSLIDFFEQMKNKTYFDDLIDVDDVECVINNMFVLHITQKQIDKIKNIK